MNALARAYSFIGFGKCLEVRLDQDGLAVGGSKLPRPASKAALLVALRQALAAAPKPLPEMAGVPLAGGLVGYSSYDVVRYFERLPAKAKADNLVPDLHYVAPDIASGVRSPRAASRCCMPAANRNARRCVVKSSRRCAAACLATRRPVRRLVHPRRRLAVARRIYGSREAHDVV